MAIETITYKGFPQQFLAGVDTFTHNLGQQALESYFTKKAEARVSKYRRGNHPLSDKTSFELTEWALNALGTEAHKFKLTGETDKALALASLYEQAAARNVRKAMMVFAHGSPVLAQGLCTEAADFLIGAARHQVIAARDLSDISCGRATLSESDSNTLRASINQLDSPARAQRMAGLFGLDGQNELEKAIKPAKKILMTVPAPKTV